MARLSLSEMPVSSSTFSKVHMAAFSVWSGWGGRGEVNLRPIPEKVGYKEEEVKEVIEEVLRSRSLSNKYSPEFKFNCP